VLALSVAIPTNTTAVSMASYVLHKHGLILQEAHTKTVRGSTYKQKYFIHYRNIVGTHVLSGIDHLSNIHLVLLPSLTVLSKHVKKSRGADGKWWILRIHDARLGFKWKISNSDALE
jgi:hypothetical protein